MTKTRFPMSLPRFMIGIGSLFLAVSAIGAFYDRKAFFQSYLFSFLFWSDLPLGSIPLLMVFFLTGGNWGSSIQKTLESVAATVLPVAFFFIPLLFGLHHIYPWVDPKILSELKIDHQIVYSNPIAFTIRTFFYFVAWVGLNYFLQSYSKSWEKTASSKIDIKRKRLSAGGLVLLSLVSSFASIDWQMSIEPKWYSTIYGLVYSIGQSLSAYAFIIFIFGHFAKKEGFDTKIPKKTAQDLGNILLTLVMVWAYLSFMQYLIIWSGNLPHEVTWFKSRTQGGWQTLAVILILFQFSAPFILLLFRSMKNHVARLGWIAMMVFVIRIIDHYWMLVPGLQPHSFQVHWQVITTWLGLGGLWLSFFLRSVYGTK